MNLLRKLIPAFLWQLDAELLRSHPRVWSTRIHLHLWFLLLLNALVFALGMVLHVDTLRFAEPEELFGYMLVPAIVYFAFWVYRVVRFNVEKRFGLRRSYAEVGEFLLHLVSIALIWTIPYTLASTLAWRAGNLVDDATFTRQIDHLNLHAHAFIGPDAAPYNAKERQNELREGGFPLATESTDEPSSYDPYDPYNSYGYESYYYDDGYYEGTHQFFRSFKEYKARKEVRNEPEDENSLHSIYTTAKSRYRELTSGYDQQADPQAAEWHKARMDSIAGNFPFYFVAHGTFTPYSHDLPLMLPAQLEERYRSFVEQGEAWDHAAIAEALRIARIYHEGVQERDPASVELRRKLLVGSDTYIHRAKRQIGRIAKAKAWDYFFTEWRVMVPIIVVLAFALSILVGAFKNVYWQPFLIAAVTTGVVPILIMILTLLVARSVFDVREEVFYLYFTYLLLVAFIVVVPFSMRLRAYRTFHAVATLIANLAVPFMPLLTLFLLHEYHDVFGLRELQGMYAHLNWNDLDPVVRAEHDAAVQALREYVLRWHWGMLWAGLALYTFTLHAFFRQVYTRLFALPERK